MCESDSKNIGFHETRGKLAERWVAPILGEISVPLSTHVSVDPVSVE